MFVRAIAVSFLLSLLGCATRQTAPGVYRLLSTGPTPLLVPPDISDAAIGTRTFDFAVDKPAPSTCRSQDDVFRVEPHRRFLRITVTRDALIKHPAPWLADWTAALEKRGCIGPGKSTLLAEQIVDAVPMNPSVANRLLRPMDAEFIDLRPEYRLKVVSPILRESAAPGSSAIAVDTVTGTNGKLDVTLKSSADLLGYEIAWYAVQDDGKFAFITAESHLGQQVTTNNAPRTNYFAFPATARFYRLFYFKRVSSADHNTAVVSAPTHADLDRLTPSFSADPEACIKAPAHACTALPGQTGVTTYVQIIVNGAPFDAPADASIAEVLRSAGVRQPTSVLPSLNIRRNYRDTAVPVQFDRSRPDILAIRVAGNEDIRW